MIGDRGRAVLATAVAIVALVAGLTPPALAGAPALPRPDAFGVNIQQLVGGLSPLPEPQRLRLLSAISVAGLHLARVDAFWPYVEGGAPMLNRHRYDWHTYDRLVGDLAARHIRWQPLLNQSPRWASGALLGGAGDDCRSEAAPPSALHFADFAAFAAALAGRYGRGGDFWRARPRLPYLPVERYEIWNEENNPVRCPDGSVVRFPPGEYARLYVQARDQIHAADPRAMAITGGLSQDRPVRYATAVLAARPDLVGHVDGWGLHPYSTVWTPESVSIHPWSAPVHEVVAFRHGITHAGAPGSEPIFVTEIGWPTSGVSRDFLNVCDGRCSDRGRALVRTSTLLMRSNCNVANYMVHTWWTPETDGGDPGSAENWFGIANRDGTLKASARAWTARVRDLTAHREAALQHPSYTLC